MQKLPACERPDWQIPSAWRAEETKPHEYRVGLDSRVRHSGKSSFFLRSLVPQPNGTVFVTQIFDATRYRGKRVRLTGFIRTQKIAMQGTFGLAVLGDDGTVQGRQGVYASGTSPWRQHTIVLDVSRDAKSVHLYIQMSGPARCGQTTWGFGQSARRSRLPSELDRRISASQSQNERMKHGKQNRAIIHNIGKGCGGCGGIVGGTARGGAAGLDTGRQQTG
jgi:hypothetical protein